jgi:dihydropteroate synthase
MKTALAAGASMINDIQALSEPYALEAVAGTGCAVCLMHMKGQPATMQREPRYDDVVAEVKAFLGDAVRKARFAGIGADRIVIDPGFGFGKTAAHNLEILRKLGEFRSLGVPVVAGLSRKSTIGHITGRPVEERPRREPRHGFACARGWRENIAGARREGDQGRDRRVASFQ